MPPATWDFYICPILSSNSGTVTGTQTGHILRWEILNMEFMNFWYVGYIKNNDNLHLQNT